MLAADNAHDDARCMVRGCPIVLPKDTLAEWGTSDFLIASSSWPTIVPQHEHYPLQLSFVLSGSWLHSFGPKRTKLVAPGEVAFIPSGETHGTHAALPGELITINAEQAWCEEHCDLPAASFRGAKLQTVEGKGLQEILRQASVLLHMEDPDELYIGNIGLTATLGIFHELGLRPRHGRSIHFPGSLRRVVRWIDEHLGEKISLPHLASIAGCSQWHLIRLFDSFVGTSPAKYVVEQRLQKSREFLCVPGADLTETALRCGFSSQSHFTRVFVKRYGEPPGAYRTKRQSIRLGLRGS